LACWMGGGGGTGWGPEYIPNAVETVFTCTGTGRESSVT